MYNNILWGLVIAFVVLFILLVMLLDEVKRLTDKKEIDDAMLKNLEKRVQALEAKKVRKIFKKGKDKDGATV